MSKHAVVVEDGQRTKRMGRRLKVGAGIFGGMMAIGTGVAVAAWLVTGSGTGSVSTQAIQNLGVAVDGIGGFYPGMSAQTTARISNPNGFPVTITSATATSDSPCYTIAVDSPGPIGSSVVAGARALQYDDQHRLVAAESRTNFTLTVTMPATADSTCANAPFTPTVTVNGQVGS